MRALFTKCVASPNTRFARALAQTFVHPVDDSVAPGYSKIVKTPMCWSDVKRNINRGLYDGYKSGSGAYFTRFDQDVKLIYANCIKYNHTKDGKVYREAAVDQRADYDEYLGKMVAKIRSEEDKTQKDAVKAKEEGAWSVKLDADEHTPGGGGTFSMWKVTRHILRDKDMTEALLLRLFSLVEECVKARTLPSPEVSH